MLKQIKEAQDAWRATQRTLDIKVVINGKTYNATDINSLKYDSGAYTGDTFSIGSTYSNNVQIEFSHLVEGLKLGMEVHPSIGIKTSKGYIYEPLGVFIISSEIKMDRNNNLTSISASDRFCGLEGTYKSKLAYPARVLDVIAEICAQSGVKANADDLARLPHQADLPIPISGQSYRKALGWIAQLYAGYATFDRQGLFTIRTIAEPNYELDPSQYEQAGLTKNEAPYKIGGIQCQTVITTKTRDGENTEETKTYQVGDTSGSQIKLENNIMTPDRLNNIWEQIKDISFYPFNLNWFGNPAIEAGDWLRLEDKQGNKFIVPNNSYTLDFNGGLSATSKADQTSSTDSAISWRGTYAQIIEELQARKAPDGIVIFPPSVAEPPKNAKPNDVWFKQNGNSTELWVFTAQEDGSGKWIRRDLTPDEIKKQVQEVQSGLSDAKKQIADNLDKADGDIAELNVSIREQKGTIDGLSATVNTIAIPKITDVTNKVSDALTKINDQKNIVSGLQNQATQQGKDISKITTDVHGVTVDLANLNGDVNQTKATVQGLQTTLGNAQGDIAQIKVDAKNLSTSLSGKVDNYTYANFVNATNSALNAKLVASDLNGYAKTTDVQATANGLQVNINSVADRMNNLKIGGRNLVSNTGKEYVMGFGIPNTTWQNGYAHSALPQGDGNEILPQSNAFFYELTPQREYTQTIWFQTDAKIKDLNNTKITWFSWKDNHDFQPAKIQQVGTNSYKLFSTYIWPKTKKDNGVRLFDIWRLNQSFDLTSGTYLNFGKLKLEVGNTSTDWTPALEDTEHDISELSARITTNSQQFSSYYTKSETDSRTNSAKNDAINTIKSDSNWHGLSNILTNSGFLQTADGFVQKVQQTTQPVVNSINGGGVNLLTNTSTLQGFNNAGNSGNYTGFNIESKESHVNETNGDEIKTNVFHVYGNDLNHVPIYLGQNFTLAAGTWTISFLARNNSSGNEKNKVSFYTDDCANRGWTPLGTSDDIDNVWRKHKITFTTSKTTYEQNPRIHMPTSDRVPGGSLYLANFKLESGPIATTWCPAPEDYATQVAFSELNQTVVGLRSTVSNNYGTLNSQINQTAGTIRNEVTDKVNSLQSQITQNANNINLKVNAGGDLSNICLNPNFIDGSIAGWENIESSTGNGGSPSKFYGRIQTRDAFYGNMFSVSAGDKYYFSVYAWPDQSTHNFSLGFTYLKKDGSWDWQSAIVFTPNERFITKTGSITIPQNILKARIWVQIDATSNYGNWWFTNVNVRKNDTLAQINMSAGTTLIQNDKIYMDASSTVFSGKAFIPNAAITNISADKINTGTLDAGRINVINLNANNITTGTINGANLKINLNDGNVEFQQGRIHNWNNTIDININQNYISTANYDTRAILKDGELQLVQPGLFDKSSDPYLRIHNWLTGSSWATGVIEARNGITINQKKYEATSIFDNKGYTNTWAGFYTGTSDYTHELLTAIGGANKGVIIHGGTYYKGALNSQNVPRILVGSSMYGDHLGDNRIRIEADYVHIPSVNAKTTGSAPNVYVSPDGALVRSTSASKYKTDIQRSYSTDYGDKLLNLPTAIWTDKGQKERYKAGKRHIKPEKYFGMIAEDLADAGLDLLISRNPQTHEIEGIQYERIAPALLPVIKELKDKVNRLEKKVNE